ncbi:MAG: vWA domain-containing protein, partial [Nannocystaceae bacterium]
MKLGVLTLLTTASMALSSASVWSLTSPQALGESAPAVAGVDQPTGPSTTLAETFATPEPPAPAPAVVDNSRFTAGETLMIDGSLGHGVLQSGRDNETFVLLEVHPGESKAVATSTPVNLAIVVDHSGSMRGARLQNAIRAARGMVERLRDGDTVSVVGYNNATETIVPATTLSPSNRAQVMARIQPLPTRGNTCMSCGLEAGLAMLQLRTGAVNRMLVLSDGEANRGVKSIDGLRGIAAQARQRGVAISSIGVDVDYNERVMLALARESNGRHHFVERATDLARVFDEELRSLVQTIAKNTSINLELADGVELLEVFDRTFQRFGNRLVIPMGTFTAGERKTVLARVRAARGSDANQSIAKVEMAYEDLITGKQGTCSGALAARLTSDPGEVSELDPIVLTRLTRAETAEALRTANTMFANGQSRAAQKHLETQIKRVKKRKKAWSSSKARRPARKWG